MTKKIPLTQDQFALVDDEDFDRINKSLWYAVFNPDIGNYYAVRTVWKSRNTILMHKEIIPSKKGQHIDHIDGDTLNNQKGNLRPASPSQNHGNSRRYSTNTSGYKGVSWITEKGRWRASMTYNYKTIHIGYYLDKEDAARAYDKRASELFGDFARLNFQNKGE